MNGKISCKICGEERDERAIQWQAFTIEGKREDVALCGGCDGYYYDSEIYAKLTDATLVNSLFLHIY